MKYLFGMALLTMFFFNSCGNGNTNPALDSGFEYVYYTNVEGENPKAGDFVFFEMDVLKNNGELLQSMRGQGQQPSVQIPTTEMADVYKKNPVLDVLRYTSIGDSIGLFVPVDSLPNPPPELVGMTHFEYRIAVKNILSEEESKAKMEKEQQELLAKAAIDVERAKTTMAADLEAYNGNTLGDKLIKDESGLELIIHEEGAGAALGDGDKVDVHYYGSLLDGTSFDDSFKRGAPYQVVVNRSSVIQGWHKGLSLLNYGSKATLFIPYELAYGEQGREPQIPGKAKLAFYMEIAE